MTINEIFAAILTERELQVNMWDDGGHDDAFWLSILTEEVGEAAHEINCGGATTRAYELRQELIQAAAVIVSWLHDLTRESA